MGRKAGPARTARLPLPPWLARTGRALNRLASSAAARTLVTLVILGVAAVLIRQELRSARLADIARAVAATPPWAIALAGVFTVAAYLCEAAVEWHALRFIGRRLPVARTILAASGASALSIAMGFGLASGSAARLRFYAFARLTAADVAKLTALVSAALYLTGMITLGLSGFCGLNVIGAILHWPVWAVAALSGALLLPLPAWFLALSRWPGHAPEAPGVRGRVLTLLAGIGNWVFQGAAMFVLSSNPATAFPGFLAAFSLGALIGSLLGVPADLGVLEATVLGSHALGAAHQGAAALVLFRVIFQLVPLILATGAVGARQIAGAAARIRG